MRLFYSSIFQFFNSSIFFNSNTPVDIIQLLPDSVANQIAAGEVIQRPASVIKELVENAIDAGAKNIQILVCDAGKASIQVIDDGCGMSDTDARLSFERHATSKIRKATDLFSLHTMGFRGEALASIAAVAQVTLQTRTKDDEVGTRIVIAGSRVMEQEVVSCPVGSNFLIENLFFNIPARRKFLKSNATEMSNITQAFERIALVYPEIHFSLYNNGMEMLDLRASNTHQRIIDIFGKRINQQLLPVDTETSICKITGFAGKPESAKKKGCHQYFFVNGRYMKHPYFHKAVMSAYDRLLPDGEQVSYFIYFTVSPEDIDVNIHPVKTEIKFDNEQAIWQILMASVRDAVGKFSNLTALDFDTDGKPDIPVFNPGGNPDIIAPQIDFNPEYNPFNTPKSHDEADNDHIAWNTRSAASSLSGSAGGSSPANRIQGLNGSRTGNARGWEELFGNDSSNQPAKNDFFDQGLVPDAATPGDDSMMSFAPDDSLLTNESEAAVMPDSNGTYYQLNAQYIVSQANNGLMLIDQHRASQRILFEQYMKNMRDHSAHTQKVLFPEVVQFPPSYAAALDDILSELSILGFELNNLGNNSYAVEGIPSGLGGMDAVRLVNDLVTEAVELGNSATNEINSILAASLAQRAATPYGEILSNESMESLVRQLFHCSSQRYTPDGKPIINVITNEEIERRFK